MPSSANRKRRFAMACAWTLLALLLGVVGYFVGRQRGFSEAREQPQSNNDELYVKTYPIGDLLAGSHSQDDRLKVFDAVIDRVVGAASPDSWLESGKGPGEIQSFPANDAIVIAQTAKVHQQVAAVLDQMKRTRASN